MDHGLQLNIRKTKVMTTSPIDTFTLRGEEIEIVDSFIFLGSLIKADGGCSVEIRWRLALGRSAMMGLNLIFKSNKIQDRINMRLVRSLVFPVVLYGCEGWTTTKADRRKLDAFELWCWRRVLKIPWTDRVTNSSVLMAAAIPMSLEAMALRHKLSYFGHVGGPEGWKQMSCWGRPRAREGGEGLKQDGWMA